MGQLGKAAQRGDAEQVSPPQHLGGRIRQHRQRQRLKETSLTAIVSDGGSSQLRTLRCSDLSGNVSGSELV